MHDSVAISSPSRGPLTSLSLPPAAACAKAIRGGAPAQKRGGEGRRGELGVRDEGGESVRERGRRKNKRVISEFEGGVDLCSSEPNQSP